MTGVYIHILQLKFKWSYVESFVESEKGSKYKPSLYEYIHKSGINLALSVKIKISPFLELNFAY